MSRNDTHNSSSTGNGCTGRGPLRKPVVRLLLVSWIVVVLFFFSLQRGLHKFAGKGPVGQSLRELRTWVYRYTSPKASFEPERQGS